ncbi:MAG: hypothetical protein AAF639_33890 [Chloroflexota bacterium]
MDKQILSKESKLIVICESIIEAGWLAAIVATPLLFTIYTNRNFEDIKTSILATIAIVMLLAWVVKLADGGQAWSTNLSAGKQQNDTEWKTVFWATPIVGPALLFVLAMILSSWLSVIPYDSWFGAYTRTQGTYPFLATIIIISLMITHMYDYAQFKRIQQAFLLTSIPIALYALIQYWQLDPVQMPLIEGRISGNLSNPIFLATYFLFAFFITAERVYTLLRRLTHKSHKQHRLSTVIALLLYSSLALLQIGILLITNSRGPLLGLLSGLLMFGLLLCVIQGGRRGRVLLVTWVCLMLGVMITWGIINASPLYSHVRALPYVGELIERPRFTDRTRLSIWQGMADLYLEPVATSYHTLEPEHTPTDRLRMIRPLIGYGPQTIGPLYYQVYPNELSKFEPRSLIPDKAHNVSWDIIVTLGLFGYSAYILLYISLFYWTLHWLALVDTKSDTIWFMSLIGTLMVVSTIAARLILDTWALTGITIPFSLLGGMGLYLLYVGVINKPKVSVSQTTRASGDEHGQGSFLVILCSLLTANLVETSFGIPVTTTQLYFWLVVGLVFVLGQRWVGQSSIEYTAVQTEPISSWFHPHWSMSTMVQGFIFLLLAFVYTHNQRNARDGFMVWKQTWLENDTLFWLLVLTWIASITIIYLEQILEQQNSGSHPPQTRVQALAQWIRTYAINALIVGGIWMAYSLTQATWLTIKEGMSVYELRLQQANLFDLLSWVVVGWLIFAGLFYALGKMLFPTVSHDTSPKPLFHQWASLIIMLFLGSLAGIFIISPRHIAPLKADVFYNGTRGATTDEQTIAHFQEAIRRNQHNLHYQYTFAQFLMGMVDQAASDLSTSIQLESLYHPQQTMLDTLLAMSPEQWRQLSSGELLAHADTLLQGVIDMNPLHFESHVLLARNQQKRAEWVEKLGGDKEQVQHLLADSLARYEQLIRYAPTITRLWHEKAIILEKLQRVDEAEMAYLHSLDLDPLQWQTYQRLAHFYENQEAHQKWSVILQDALNARVVYRDADIPDSLRDTIASVIDENLVLALSTIGDIEGAIHAALRHQERHPEELLPMRNLIRLYTQSQQYDQVILLAEERLTTLSGQEQSAAVIEERVAFLKHAFIAYQGLGQQGKMIETLEEIRTLTPKDTQVLKNLYNLYRDQAQIQNMVDTLQALIIEEPTNYTYPFALAQLVWQDGQTQLAQQIAQHALTLAPEAQKSGIQQFIGSIQ